jgi:mannose/fructose/N-acetylgalactosamine-specific phosphotransferase system component IIC
MAQEANEESNAAFLLSLNGDVLILLGSLVLLGLGISGVFGVGYIGSIMGSMTGGFGAAAVLGVAIIATSVIGIASAVIVIYRAFLVRDEPTTRSTWGSLFWRSL